MAINWGVGGQVRETANKDLKMQILSENVGLIGRGGTDLKCLVPRQF